MLNKLLSFIRKYDMLQPGDHVVCALSGGADSVALLYAMKLLSDKLKITLSAAHFNHHLRGEESDADQAFVRAFCQRHDIDLTVGSGEIVSGKKGLEAAARQARYDFLRGLPGKIATAHTADDNAETVLLHLVRGTGLRGLGGIMPVNGNVIRPMLNVTRRDVMAFLQEYSLKYVEDSSNGTDTFLRNRLRHHVMPLLQEENPSLAENLSAMALRLRQDEQVLAQIARKQATDDVDALRRMPEALRARALTGLLEQWGVPEPESAHVELVQKLVFSDKPSARAEFPGNVTVERRYGRLVKAEHTDRLGSYLLPCPGTVELPQIGLRIIAMPAQALSSEKDRFAVNCVGQIRIRSRQCGDRIRCSGGTKTLKELYIDSKIPASQRNCVPVLEDAQGIVGVFGFGADRDRLAQNLPAVQIQFETI